MDRSNFAVFVYLKGDKSKFLYLEEAKKEEEKLIQDGWVHFSTVDAASLLEGIYNRDVIGEKEILNNCPYATKFSSSNFPLKSELREAWMQGVIWAKNKIFSL